MYDIKGNLMVLANCHAQLWDLVCTFNVWNVSNVNSVLA
jgi:hypothetical protein